MLFIPMLTVTTIPLLKIALVLTVQSLRIYGKPNKGIVP